MNTQRESPEEPPKYLSCQFSSIGISKYDGKDGKVHCKLDCEYGNLNENEGTCKTGGLISTNQIPDLGTVIALERTHMAIRKTMREEAPEGAYQ
tara:strand:+ start:1536 stop:1817 length:282 start_codon:yes stop_codon:yes gene_type:complete